MIDGSEVKQGLLASFLGDFPSNRTFLWAGIQKGRCSSLIQLRSKKSREIRENAPN